MAQPNVPTLIKPGTSFAVCMGGDPDDVVNVTVTELTPTHAYLDSTSEMCGWRPIEYVAAAIDEASGKQCPRT